MSEADARSSVDFNRVLKENQALNSKVKGYKTYNEQLQNVNSKLQNEVEELKKLLQVKQASNGNTNNDIEDMDDDLQTDSLPSIEATSDTRRMNNSRDISLSAKPKAIVANGSGAAAFPSENYDASLRSPDITSMDVNNMTDMFSKSTGVHGSSVVKNSVWTTLNITKLEKSNRTYKEHNKALLEQNRQLSQEISQLKYQISQLTKKVRPTVHEQDQSLNSSLSSMSSNGWVNVKPSSIQNTYKSEDDDQTRLVNMTPVGSDATLMQYKQHIDKLTAANKQWEEHAKKNQEDFDRQIGYIDKEKNELMRQIEELRTSEERRQVDIDRILLSAKKRCQDEETLKEEALQDLHNANIQKDQMQKQITIMERQLQGQAAFVQVVPAENYAVERNMDGNIRALQEEIAVLKQQITTYQEDFENERRDRERIQQLKEQYKEMLDNAKVDKANVDRQLAMQQRTLEHLRRMKEEVEYELRTTRRELSEMRRTIITQAPVNIFQQPPAPVPFQPAMHHGVAKWSCTHCTYENHGKRTICEICGRPGRPEYLNRMPFQSAGMLVCDAPQGRGGISQGRDVPDEENVPRVQQPNMGPAVARSNSCPDPGDLENDH